MPVKPKRSRYAQPVVTTRAQLRHTADMENLKRIRQSKGLSQEALAEMVGCNQATISKLERGNDKNVTLRLIRLIARALKVSPVELFGLPPDDQRLLDAIRQAPEDRREAILLLLQARELTRSTK